MTYFDGVRDGNWQAIQSIGDYAFYGCANLESIDIGNAITIGQYAFYNCNKLEHIFAPEVSGSIGNYAFSKCTNIGPILVFPKAYNIGTQCFNGCSQLTTLDLGADGSGGLGQYGFAACPNFRTLIIRSNTIRTLSWTNVFNNTYFASGKAGGVLYVPENLIESYQAATNWSTILGYPNNQIVAIEGSQYENYHADGTPVPEPEEAEE
jgi:hypothetical protein